ncbi:MAG: TlpA disulfide reductase family protein [Rhodoferax sp.]|nr:TlpA disulfide reductase family protein [Rhodoferax sp.]
MSALHSSRRGWLAAAAGLALAGVGAGLAWRTLKPQSQTLSEAESLFWQQQFTQLNGVMLPASSFQGKPLLVNFWATWCPPCVEELPLIDNFFRENKLKGWQVLGLAVDQAAPVNKFLTQSPLSFSVALAGFPGIEVSRSLGNVMGALPFTVVFSPKGDVLHRKMGKLTSEDLRRWEQLPV